MQDDGESGATTGEPRGADNESDATPVLRRPLSRELIIVTAIALADRDGLAGLTMRQLGHQLGVEAMSLYRYVNGREDLLEGMTARLVGQVRSHPGESPAQHEQPERLVHPGQGGQAGQGQAGQGQAGQGQAGHARQGQAGQLGQPGQLLDGWQSYLQRFAHGVREVAVEHPLIFPLIATRHPGAGWLRPPLRSVAIVEDFLNALTARGLSDRQAVGIYRSFTSFLLGHLLLEAATLGAPTSPAEEPLNEGDADVPTPDDNLDLGAYPTVQRLRATLSEDHAVTEFEQGLEALLDRLDLDLSQ